MILPEYLIRRILDRTGSSKITGGAVVDPVAFLQLSLPEDYTSFKIDYAGARFTGVDSLALAFSQDGGATWLADDVNFDTYAFSGIELYTDMLTGAKNGGIAGAADSIMDLTGLWGGGQTDPAADPIGISGEITIFPGNDVSLASGRHTAVWWCENILLRKDIVHTDVSFALSGVATVPIAPGRVTDIALLAWGDGNFPPTGPSLMTIESYTLYGTK